jgi:ubiquinone/menaquinone biosynthesis C-methylase UbiE
MPAETGNRRPLHFMEHLLELTARAETTHFWFQGFRKFVAPVIASLAGGRRDLRLVDCGCGTGYNLGLLAPYGRVVGFDLANHVVVRGQSGHPSWDVPGRANGQPGSNGHQPGALDVSHARALVRADVSRIPFASGQFDIATSFDVLQCIDADGLAVREMARILKPGGAVVMTLAALDILAGDHAEAWGEVRRYTKRTASELVEQAGLRPERVQYLFGSLFPVMGSVRIAQRLLRPFRELRPDTDIRVPAPPVNSALAWLVSAEAALARHVPAPIGSSLLVVGRKPQ